MPYLCISLTLEHLESSTDAELELGVIAVSQSCKSYPITGLDRPLGLQEVEWPSISAQSAQEGGKVAIRTDRPLSSAKKVLHLVDGSTAAP